MLFTDKTIAYLLSSARAVAFDKTGNQLAIAMRVNDQAVIQLWDTSRIEKRYLSHTEYLKKCAQLWFDEAVSLVWDKKSLVFCGTSHGKIFIFDTVQRQILKVFAEEHSLRSVLEVQFNSKFQYFASCDGAYLVIWYWDGITLQPHSRSDRKNRLSFAFHPWNPNKMAIAECEPPKISIMDIPSRLATCTYRENHKIRGKQNSIQAITFNKVTGELVVSIWNRSQEKSEVLVLGALDRVVDVLAGHERKVNFMIWSPNGKILGRYWFYIEHIPLNFFKSKITSTLEKCLCILFFS